MHPSFRLTAESDPKKQSKGFENWTNIRPPLKGELELKVWLLAEAKQTNSLQGILTKPRDLRIVLKMCRIQFKIAQYIKNQKNVTNFQREKIMSRYHSKVTQMLKYQRLEDSYHNHAPWGKINILWKWMETCKF